MVRVQGFTRPNIIQASNIIVNGNRVRSNNKWLPPCPAKGKHQAVINGKVYIDGYEFKKGKWKKTFRAFLYTYF